MSQTRKKITSWATISNVHFPFRLLALTDETLETNTAKFTFNPSMHFHILTFFSNKKFSG